MSSTIATFGRTPFLELRVELDAEREPARLRLALYVRGLGGRWCREGSALTVSLDELEAVLHAARKALNARAQKGLEL